MNHQLFNHKITEIRDDRQHGASELARRCLAILAEAAQNQPAADVIELRERLWVLARELALTRPSMTPISNLLRHWRDTLILDDTMKLDAFRTQAMESATMFIAASTRAVSECAIHAACHIGANQTVMTHSLSSTVLEVCRLLKDQGLQMIVTESRPLEEGRQLAKQLAAWHIPTTYITDAQAGIFISQADCVLVGADSVLADGTVVNKAGTYLLALAAREQGVPFYVCCETFKWRDAKMPPLELEEMATAELDTPDRSGVTVRNVYFDRTPARFVSAWIDETGIQTRIE